MRRFVFILFSAFILLLSVSCSCSRGNLHHDNVEPDTMPFRVDTIMIEDSTKIDSLEHLLSVMRDSLILYRDTVLYDNYINARRIEKIKYYINICDKKSTNKKYFFGWIKRAVSE